MRRAVMLGVALVVSVGIPAQAADLTNWGAADVIHVTDPTGDAAHLSRDITDLWFRANAGNLYFRIDLGMAPVQVSGQYAPEVGIAIDFPNGQGGGSNSVVGGSNYIPENVGVGVDTLVLSHYTLGGAWTSHHRHIYQGPAAAAPRVDTVVLGTLGGAVDFSENGGTTIQWSIPASELKYNDYLGTSTDVVWTGGAFTIYAATQSIDVPSTFDTTAAVVVPEPVTLSLLALGGLALIRRRRV